MFRNPHQPVISLLVHLTLMGVLLFAFSWYTLSFNQFFITDTALRFIQIENIIASDWQTLTINYPLQSIDPEFQHTPYNVAFSVVDGQILFNISPFFPLATAYFYHWLGTAGFALIPVLGSLFTALALYQLAGLAQLPHRTLLLWATVLATPLLFYSLKLWDHTLGVALSTWAVYGLARGQHLGQPKYAWLGGMCLGVGLGQRPELYTFAIAVGLAFIVVYRLPKATFFMIGGGLIGAFPIWLAQWRWVGHSFGMAFAPHLFGYGKHTAGVVMPKYGDFVKVVSLLTDIYAGNVALLATLLILWGVAIFVLATRVKNQQVNTFLLMALILFVISYAIYGYYSSVRLLGGIVPTFPLFVFALVYPKYNGQWVYNSQLYHFIALTVLSYLTLMFVFWPTYGGTQWGSRYLLGVYPLLGWMALFVFASYCQFWQGQKVRQMWYITGVVLLSLSIVLQFSGVYTLHRRHEYMGRIQTAMNNLPVEIILTNHMMIPTLMAPVPNKQFLYVRNSQELELLATRLATDGVSHIGIVPGGEFAQSFPALIVPQAPFNGLVLQPVEPYTYQIIPTP